MKRFIYFTVFFAFLLSFNLVAQDFATKGDIEAGGNLGWSSTTSVSAGESADESSSNLWLEPYIGYFLMNNLEIGIVPSFSSSSFGDNSNNGFGIYLAPAWNFDLKSNVYPFIEGRIGYNTESFDNGTTDVSSSGIAWCVRGGVKVQVGSSALVNFDVMYKQVTLNPENYDGDRNGYNQLGIMAGFTIFFNK